MATKPDTGNYVSNRSGKKKRVCVCVCVFACAHVPVCVCVYVCVCVPAHAHVPVGSYSVLCGLVTQPCPTLCSPIDYIAHQAPLSQPEYWSRLPFPSPGELPDPGTKPGSPALQADPLPSEPPGKPGHTERD